MLYELVCGGTGAATGAERRASELAPNERVNNTLVRMWTCSVHTHSLLRIITRSDVFLIMVTVYRKGSSHHTKQKDLVHSLV